ncbi:MAG: hypothetical protein ACE5E6_12865, partial [Phycisphaerae bacterium]
MGRCVPRKSVYVCRADSDADDPRRWVSDADRAPMTVPGGEDGRRTAEPARVWVRRRCAVGAMWVRGRRRVWALLFGIAVIAVAPADGQPAPEHLQLSMDCILDEAATPTQRQRCATQILLDGSPEADALLVELLGRPDRPDVQRAVSEVIAARVLSQPAIVGAALADPLIALLAA